MCGYISILTSTNLFRINFASNPLLFKGEIQTHGATIIVAEK